MGNIRPSQIHPQHLSGVLLFWWLCFHANLDGVGTFALDQSGRFGIGARQLFSLVMTDCQLKAFSTLHRGQRHRPVFLAERKDTSIIGSKATLERFDRAVFLLCHLAGRRCLSAYLLSQVTGQAETGTDFVVAQRLEFDCVNYLLGCVLVTQFNAWRKASKVASNFAACDSDTLSLQETVRTWVMALLLLLY